MKKTFIILALACASANAAVLSGITATADSTHAANQTPANLINNSGLSVVGSVTATHSPHTNAFDQWHSAVGTVSNTNLDFDLNGAFDLTTMYIWQANQIGTSGDRLNRGVKQYDLLVSTNGGGSYTEVLTDQTLAISGGGNIAANSIGLIQAGVTNVRIHIDSNHGDGDVVGLSEVKFDGVASVPEPTSAVLLGLGAITLSLRRRR